MSERPFERQHYAVLQCHELQKAVVIDLFEQRIRMMRQRIVAWGKVVALFREKMADEGQGSRMLMIGLTYRGVADYRPSHLNTYLKSLKRMLGEKLFAFSWVAELQERGAVHYHLVLVVRKGTHIPLADKSGMWPHGSSSVLTVRSPYYLVMYTGKKHQKDLAYYPKSCRLYAASIRLPDPLWRQTYRRWSGLEPVERVLGKPLWEYAGSALTLPYAVEVLPCSSYSVELPSKSLSGG